MILPDDHPIIQGLFELARSRDPAAMSHMRLIIDGIRSAYVAQRSEVLRPMAGARAAAWN